HTILEQAPPVPAADDTAENDGDTPVRDEVAAVKTALVPWNLSAKGAEALRAQARQRRDRLAADPGLDQVDVGYSLATTRWALPQRAALVATGLDDFRRGLRSLASDGATVQHV
ncbi:CurL C-terminal domain-containing protein, partial [Saccharothrix sp. ST-888]|uniref:CurL C-terminal domain-containing protein n=1 Tax=Saccharothrix sp. ST-888 TaxID=1427391 RepID=UPI0005ECBFC9